MPRHRFARPAQTERGWRVDEVDADFDDEEGKVQLRFTLSVRVTGTGTASLDTIPFTVTTLAKV